MEKNRGWGAREDPGGRACEEAAHSESNILDTGSDPQFMWRDQPVRGTV